MRQRRFPLRFKHHVQDANTGSVTPQLKLRVLAYSVWLSARRRESPSEIVARALALMPASMSKWQCAMSFEVLASEMKQQRLTLVPPSTKTELGGRVKVNMALPFTHSGLPSFAFLELVRRCFRQLGLFEQSRRHVGATAPGTDYGVVGMIMVA